MLLTARGTRTPMDNPPSPKPGAYTNFAIAAFFAHFFDWLSFLQFKVYRKKQKPMTGIEPVPPPLPRERSTTGLDRLLVIVFSYSSIACILFWGRIFFPVGDARTRTGSIMRARQAFYQLNYVPLERKGFEPMIQKIVFWFSKPTLSATQPSLLLEYKKSSYIQ